MAFAARLPAEVSVYEVGPRDGLQNEAAAVTTTGKVRLVEALVASGLRRIEVTSFVSPRWIPQLADADELVRSLSPAPDVCFTGLCPNMQGLERATKAGLEEIAVFLSVSETHNRRNINKSIAGTLDVFGRVVPEALRRGMRVRAYISTLWGCPFEGQVDPKRGLDIACQLYDLGCYEVSLGDTIGVGNPRQTAEILELFVREFENSRLAVHFHDTRGMALANVLVALDKGIRTFDASVGGLGGCPYAPGAAGNLATEDLVYMLDGMGVQTGIDLQRLWEAGRVAAAVVGHELTGKVHRAGLSSLSR